MQAITLAAHGGPEQINLRHMPEPECGAKEIRIQLRFAALNHLDLFVRQGWPGLKLVFPHILGSDGSGNVLEVGNKVPAAIKRRLKRGTAVLINPGVACGQCEFCKNKRPALCVALRIYGEQTHGTYAQQICVPYTHVYAVPKHLSLAEAAALPLTFLTAWRMLVTQARLRKGETLLIQGIGGGVALAALQIATHLGCDVLVSSRSAAKLARAGELGAKCGFASGPQLAREVRAYTNKRGVDVVFDSVGKQTWEQSLAALSRGGRLVTCGATSGPQGTTDINRLFWSQLQIFGSTMGSPTEFAQMLRFVTRHRLKPIIDSTFTLADYAQAAARLDAGEQMGKILIEIPAAT